PFPRDKVLDQTRAGLRAGLVELILPEDAGGAQTLFEGPGIWIRAAVIEAPEALCKLQGLHVQALEVEEQTQGVALSESVDLLPASTITRARTPQPSLRKVTQPYPGFGGRGSETAPAFQQRVSERLRHKDRAITV